MNRDPEQLRIDALAIWQAAVAAVDSERLVRENVTISAFPPRIRLVDLDFSLRSFGRIAVIGAGKAGAGMATGFVAALGDEICRAKHLTGWLNVPDDCVREIPYLTLHPARPPGINEPTARGVEGAEQILKIVRSLQKNDLCVCLLSGGGSALLPAPAEGISLEEKLALTRHLSGAGANIQQLNTVRKQLSRIKGGRLAAACNAGTLIVLVISDVLGDPLDVIASGPTVADTSTPEQALEVMRQFDAARVAPSAFQFLQRKAAHPDPPPSPRCSVEHRIIGNNAVAVDAAGMEAERRGYRHAMVCANQPEGFAEDIGRHLALMAHQMRSSKDGPNCLITGGEPVVRLVPPEMRGKGGRNQQLVLAAMDLFNGTLPPPCDGIVLLSGGTDGEDGPTDAAGAWIDEQVAARARSLGLSSAEFLAHNDAYHFFESLGSLIKTGPTHTNVCDVRVVVVGN